jgi:hypothetical protein
MVNDLSDGTHFWKAASPLSLKETSGIMPS